MELPVPGRGLLDLRHLVLDMNGTLAVDGLLVEGVAERLARLSTALRPVILTADTHGGLARVRDELGVDAVVLTGGGEAEQKLSVVRRLGAAHAVAVGNGANDALMLKESAVGICVVGSEGAAVEALLNADAVVTDVRDALDLLLSPRRLLATLRK